MTSHSIYPRLIISSTSPLLVYDNILLQVTLIKKNTMELLNIFLLYGLLYASLKVHTLKTSLPYSRAVACKIDIVILFSDFSSM